LRLTTRNEVVEVGNAARVGFHRLEELGRAQQVRLLVEPQPLDDRVFCKHSILSRKRRQFTFANGAIEEVRLVVLNLEVDRDLLAQVRGTRAIEDAEHVEWRAVALVDDEAALDARLDLHGE